MSLRLVLMGVSGCGKSRVGAELAGLLGLPYVDGDDLHPAENVAKMRSGAPLGDADRWPWLDLVAARLREGAPVILGCSALRRAYRDRIRGGAGGPVTFVHLAGDQALIARRLAERRGHYMPASLLDSQFAALEPPVGEADAFSLSIAPDAPAIAAEIAARIAAGWPRP